MGEATSGGLVVRRLAVSCAVASDHPNPEQVRWRLDEVAAGPLRAALERALAPLDALRSDEVILLRRLETTFDVDVSRSPDEVAKAWAAQIALAVGAALQSKDGNGVARFADAAALLARFLVDRADGHADRWYYRRFDGLSPLPVAAALRTALIEDAERGVAALRALDAAELERVASALGAREARRVIESWGKGTDATSDASAVEALIPSIEAWRGRAVRAPSAWSDALTLIAATPSPSRLPLASVRLAAAIASWARAVGPSGGGRTAERAPSTQRAGVTDAPVEDAPDMAPLAQLPSATLARVRAALGVPPNRERSSDGLERWRTRFGGLLLLLPHVAELPIDAVWEEPTDRALARLFVLARCAGGARARSVLVDDVLLRLLTLQGEPAPPIDDWLAKNAEIFERRFAPTLGAPRAARARAARRLPARAPHHGAVCVTRSEPEGHWLRIEPLGRDLRAALRAGPVVIDFDAGVALETTLDVSLPSARAATRVLRHLASDEPSSAPAADLALALAAQHVLCAFSRRLPGFSESSPGHLWDNFLTFPATLEEIAGRRICRVGRPPLGALLVLTGALRGTLAVPWLDGPIELHGGG